MHKLTIEASSNGYILTGKFNDSEIVSKVVIETPDTENGELESMKQLLWEIREYFGVYYSKHNENNLEIEIRGKDEKQKR